MTALRYALLCVFLLVQSAHAGLSPVEKQITQVICVNQTAQLKLLEQLVNINSGTTNLSGIHQVGEILRPQFEALGFHTQWLEEPETMHRAGTLIASRQGKQGKRILLIGHLDTVFAQDNPFQHFERHGSIARGPGVIDDKGGVIIILYALKALAVVHALDNCTLTVVLTGDEEESGKPTSISRKPLIDAARNSEVALDFEWSITRDTATIARRGISSWLLKTSGIEAHSSEIFQKTAGYGAVFELVRILDAMRSQLSGQQYLTFNPGIVLGGSQLTYNKDRSEGSVSGKANVITKTALAKGDLRFLTAAQEADAKNKILSIVKQHLPNTTASIHFEAGIPGMAPTLNNKDLLNQYSQASQDLGFGLIKPLDPAVRGAGDISYIAAIVPFNLAGLGALGTGAHSVNETLDINSLPIQTQRAALLIYRLTK